MTGGERGIKQKKKEKKKKDSGIHEPSGKRNIGKRKSSSNVQEKEDQGCLLWSWYRTTAQGLKTRIEKHILLQGIESVRHLSVLRLKILYGTCKRGHCLFCMSECAIFLAIVKKSCFRRKSSSSSGDNFRFPEDEGKTEKFFVIFFFN